MRDLTTRGDRVWSCLVNHQLADKFHKIIMLLLRSCLLGLLLQLPLQLLDLHPMDGGEEVRGFRIGIGGLRWGRTGGNRLLWFVSWVYGTIDKLLDLAQEVWGVFNMRLMLLLGGSLLLLLKLLPPRVAGGGYQLLDLLNEV